MLGKLTTHAAAERQDLLADPVAAALLVWPAAGEVEVGEIDPELADTAAFCDAYGVTMQESANCVIVGGRRERVQRYAACLIPANTRADVNGLVRRHLDVRKASFAPMAEAVQLTGMDYGGITAIGLPASWPILVDAAVVATPLVVIGSGVRRSKLVLPGMSLATLPGAVVLDGLGRPVS